MLPENIRFTTDPVKTLCDFLKERKYSKAVVLLDEQSKTHCYPILQGLPVHETIVIPDGEENKNLRSCEIIWQRMTDLHIDRHAVMIIVGGGVLGDMGGFCAATYKRGIDFVLVPTTLLAQVDASIGGKLGIDFNNYKNHIGVFQQPILTLLFSGFLSTLPPTELRSGFAEVIKHILISDKELWDLIRSLPLEKQPWDKLIKHSVEFKADIVTKDPREKGLRKILNAGHTIGHALETYFININQRILHGEAIAIGLIAEGFIALNSGKLSESELSQIVGFITSVYGTVEITNDQIEEIAKLALQDKKNKNNRILCVLQKGIGSATWDNEISIENLKKALEYYCS